MMITKLITKKFAFVGLATLLFVTMTIVFNPAYATHEKDVNGDFIVHDNNYQDFDTPEDITIEQVKAMRSLRVNQLDAAIQNLPDGNFSEPVDVARSTLHDKVMDIDELIMNDQLYDAIVELGNLRKLMDGDAVSGDPHDDLIIDSIGRAKIISMVDGIAYTTELATTPAQGISRELTEVPCQNCPPSDYVESVDSTKYKYIAIGLAIGAAALGGGLAYTYKKTKHSQDKHKDNTQAQKT